jgi:hypothetical protein
MVKVRSLSAALLVHDSVFSSTVDPWRPDTPHSDDAEDREDTILRPFKLIPGESFPNPIFRSNI